MKKILIFVCFVLFQSCFFSVAKSENTPHRIKHFISIMLENRSFDHLIGYLAQTLNPKINGLSGNETVPVSFTNSSTTCKVSDDGDQYNTPNAGHSYHATMCEQYNTHDVIKPPYPKPSMDGFVACQQQYGCKTLASIPVQDIPVSSMFVQHFALFDAWFSGFPGPTEVNRAFFHSTTSNGYCNNPDDLEYVRGFSQESLLHSLSSNNISVGVYMADSVSSTLFFQDQRSVEALETYHEMSAFFDHAANGTLPTYSVIEPRYFSIPLEPATDEHPSSHSIAAGEKWLGKIYDAIRSSPEWESTALLITYDEAGGLYDHVQSPTNAVSPQPGLRCKPNQGDAYFDFTRLGIRVPAFLISPWVEKGVIQGEPTNQGNTQFCHSSMAKTVHNLYMPKAKYLTDRHEWAASFESLFNVLSAPRKDTPTSAPHVPRQPTFIDRAHEEYKQPLNDLQQNFLNAYASGWIQGVTKVPTGINNEAEASQWIHKIFQQYKQQQH